MSDNICDKCGEMVRVPDGYEFNDGDLCWDCEREANKDTITRLESRLAAAEKVIEADETILTGDVNFTYENRVPVLEQHDAYWRQYNPAKIGEGPDAAKETE